MKLDSRKPDVSVPLRLHPLNWSNPLDTSTTGHSTWVQLQECPTPYSHDEALLLCQHSETKWVVWVPDYGEMVLNKDQFYL
ncbi:MULTISPECIES: hypothetical protein [unclassified Coleofasciculus]|uniref:hypothetical protein n=1 Tax=unclassified Coleofasciculus TaxID=2692782 RepID=UPI0018801F08|nr:MULTISPECIES: hypothetical protein [unclassified Coleofasciculus]MBE9127018.1 hypothetical protein [Coleofasciculus sp. LEGE 07081]MBE9149125.1 hypothetical protein [Coleofasciculus sp. LEGE 07092]